MRHVRLDDTKRVVEIFSEPREDLRRVYSPEFISALREAPDDILPGKYRHEDGSYRNEPADIPGAGLGGLIPIAPLDLNSISIGHAERLYELAQIEAAAPLNGADGKPLPGPATVLLEILGL